MRAVIHLKKSDPVLRAIIENLGPADGDYLQAVTDALKSQFKGVIVLGGIANNAVALVAAISPELTARIQAGKENRRVRRESPCRGVEETPAEGVPERGVGVSNTSGSSSEQESSLPILGSSLRQC